MKMRLMKLFAGGFGGALGCKPERFSRRILCMVLGAAVLAVAAGCTAVKVSHVGKSMVEVENNGWLLFNLIPLASGDADNPESKVCKFFQNSVTLDNNIDLITYAMRQEGAVGVKDLTSYTSDEYVLFLLLRRHSMHTSAVLVMPHDEDADDADIHRVETRLERDPAKATPKEPPAPSRLPPKRPQQPMRSESPYSRPPDTPQLKVLDF